MTLMNRARTSTLLVIALFNLLCVCASLAQTPGQSTPAKYPNYPSETPDNLKPPGGPGFDYDRREVMIPMRDGVKLHTVVLVPRSATKAKPAAILLTRTPYNADELTTHTHSAHLGPSLWGYDN